ncbi:recombination protein RecT [Glycomyces halotolerans]
MNTAPTVADALELRDQAAQTPAPPSLVDEITGMEPKFQAAMPRGAEATQLIRDAFGLLRTTPLLGQCNRLSVLGGLMNIAQLALRPGVLGQAWLVPFFNSKGGPKNASGKPKGEHVAQLVIGYRGYVELAHRSPIVAGMVARTAYENDLFEVELGTADRIIHKPLMDGDRGKPIAFYAVGKFANGGYTFRWMTKAQMDSHRDRFAAKPHKGPWRDHYEAMSEKTMARQVAKYMPQATDLSRGLAVDETVRLDVNPDLSPTDASRHIEGEHVDGDETPQEDQ